MRLSVALGCLLLVGCTGPHSTGALWAERLVDQETLLYRLSDAQRAERLRIFELSQVDETLAAERTRIEAGLATCPEPRVDQQPMAPSVGDRARDVVRVHAVDDPGGMTSVAQIALADWYARRARTTGDSRFCDAARNALAGDALAQRVPSPAFSGRSRAGYSAASSSAAGSSADEVALAVLLGAPATAIVSRDPDHAVAPPEAGTVSQALSNYAVGYVDAVQAMTPLPQYLAAVYGGTVLGTSISPVVDGATPELVVDKLAPAYPNWEPDALYAVLVAK